jgi:hypothetical protein
MFKHLKSDKAPPAKMSGNFTIAPAMQAIIVDRIPIVHPQLASIVGQNAEPVIRSPENSHATCPANCKVITSGKTWPSAACVPVVHHLFPTSHVRTATIQVRAPAPLTEVEGILAEDSMTINDATRPVASCTRNHPSVSSVATSVPQEHPSMTTTFKHFKPDEMPSTAKMPVGLPITPSM